VLEDSAQGWGADIGGVRCGALGDAAAFSFFPSKNLGACGEGGLVSTNDDEIAAKVRMLRVHGQSRRYIHDEIGYNSRLHSMQAAILGVKLPHGDRWNDARRANAARYAELLGDLPLQLPYETPGARHVYHQYTLRLENREPVCDALTKAEVGWAIYYPMPLHLQPVYAGLGYSEGDLPQAERASRDVMSLPIFPELRPDEIDAVARAVRAGFE
jgi:dTDP-4-amino-4,6-dideoxygalactose transaminase